MPFSRQAAVRLLPFVLLLALVVGPSAATSPASVTLAGSFQSELGCPGDWDPSCSTTDLSPVSGGFAGDFTIPAGAYEYKAALNHSWDESYGANGGSANIQLAAPGGNVHFAYDATSHLVGDSVNGVIVTVPGSYQTALGCSGDWDPSCLKTWLEHGDGGIYTSSTRAIPPGNYEAKATINGSWDENYGAGGAANGPNIQFSVTAPNQLILFSYDSHTHVLTIKAGHAADNNVEWDGLGFDSRNTLYRTPQGAVPAGTPVTFRFRTFHNDVTGVTLRDYSVDDFAQHLIKMNRVASGVSCYEASLAAETCDFWQATISAAQPDLHWYRFIVTDGISTAYYGDDTSALDGGAGATTSDPRDWSYALTFYDPSFTTPAWAKNAVVYQIFPDRSATATPRTTRRRATCSTTSVPSSCRGARFPRATAAPTRHRAHRARSSRGTAPAPVKGRTDAITTAATSRVSGSRFSNCKGSASTRSTSTRSSGRSRTTATTPPTTRRATRTSGR
jgi:hypothetical protein